MSTKHDKNIFIDTKGNLWSSPMCVKKQKNKNKKLPQEEALENKNTSETSTLSQYRSQGVSCFYFLFTIAELALVN